MDFMIWWEKLNVALVARGEPEAPYGEARQWYGERPNWKNLEPSEERILNRVINWRKPF